jgi:hypothetical protein
MLEDLEHALSGDGLTVRQHMNCIVGFAQGAAVGAGLGFASKAYRDDFWSAVENFLK